MPDSNFDSQVNNSAQSAEKLTKSLEAAVQVAGQLDAGLAKLNAQLEAGKVRLRDYEKQLDSSKTASKELYLETLKFAKLATNQVSNIPKTSKGGSSAATSGSILPNKEDVRLLDYIKKHDQKTKILEEQLLKLAKAGLKKGSIFVHDTHAEDILKDIRRQSFQSNMYLKKLSSGGVIVTGSPRVASNTGTSRAASSKGGSAASAVNQEAAAYKHLAEAIEQKNKEEATAVRALSRRLNTKEAQEELTTRIKAILMSREALRVQRDVYEQQTESTKSMLDSALAAGRLDKEMEKLISGNLKYTEMLNDAKAEVEDLIEGNYHLAKAENYFFTIQGKLNRSFRQGREAAKAFIGDSSAIQSKTLAIGLAAAFAAKYLSDLAVKTSDYTQNLSKFNVLQATAERRMTGFGKSGKGLEKIRDELFLNREEAAEFFKVLESGYMSGLAGFGKIASSAKALRETFGGDQTKRLESYIDLLKEIPTIDTDLSITANIDDRTATLFALAQKGKIGTVVELQAAGLAGGLGTGPIDKNSVALLNSQQRAEKAVQDLKDFVAGALFNKIGEFTPWLSETAKGVSIISKEIMGLFLLSGGIRYLGKLGTAKTLGEPAKNLFAPLSRFFKSSPQWVRAANVGPPVRIATGTNPGIVASTAARNAMAPSASFGGKTMGALKGGSASLGIGLTTAAVSYGLDTFADHLERGGDKSNAALARFASGTLEAAGTIASFAAIGSMFTPLGTIIGAGIGALVATIGLADKVGGPLSKSLDNYAYSDNDKKDNMVGRSFSNAGKGLAIMGSAILKGFSTEGYGIGRHLRDQFRTRDGVDETINDQITGGKVFTNLTATIDGNIRSAVKWQTIQQTSALEYQRAFNAIISITNNAKKALYDFQKELSGLQISNIELGGGSSGAFDKAIHSSTLATVKSYKMQTQMAKVERERILNNKELSGQEKELALMQLGRVEVLATKEFIDGLESATKAFYSAPEIMLNEIKQKIAQARFDFKIEGKNLDIKDAGKAVGDIVKEAEGKYRNTQEQGVKSVQNSKQMVFERANELRNRTDLALGEKDDSGQGLKYGYALKGQKVVKISNEQLSNLSGDQASEIFNKQQHISNRKEGDVGNIAISETDFKSIPDDIKAKLGTVSHEYADIIVADATSVSAAKVDAAKVLKEKTDILEKAIESTADIGAIFTAGRFDKEIKSRKDELDFAKSDSDKKSSPETRKALEEAEKAYTAVLVESKDAEDKYKAFIEKMTAGTGQTNTANFKNTADRMRANIKEGKDVSTDVGVSVNANDPTKEAWNKAKKDLESLVALNREREKALVEMEKANQVGNEQANAENTAFLLKKAEFDQAEKLKAAQADVINAIKEIAKMQSSQLDSAQRQVETSKLATRFASLNGLATEQRVKLLGDEAKEFEKLAELTRTKNDEAQRIIDENNKILGDSTSSKDDKNTANTKVKEATDQQIAANKVLAETMENLISKSISFADTLEHVSNSMAGRKVTSQLDLSDATFQLAEFSSDWRKANKEAYSLALVAAKERYDLTKKQILADHAGKVANIEEAYVTDMGKATTPAMMAEAESGRKLKYETLSNNEAKELALNEVNKKKQVVDAAKREFEYVNKMVDLQQSVVNAQAEFLTEVGGSWNTILKLQAQSVALEKERLDMQRVTTLKIINDSGADGQQKMQAIVDLRLEEVKYARAALGAQKSAFEGLMGMVFGSIRSSVGVMKNRDSAVFKMGRDDTRVKTRGGYYSPGGGEGSTINERAFNNQLSALGGIGNDGLGDSLNDLMKSPAQKANPDKQVQAAIVTAKSSAVSAKATAKMGKLAETKGLVVKDTKSESLLSRIAIGIEQLSKYFNGTTPAPTNNNDTTPTAAKGIIALAVAASIAQQAASNQDLNIVPNVDPTTGQKIPDKQNKNNSSSLITNNNSLLQTPNNKLLQTNNAKLLEKHNILSANKTAPKFGQAVEDLSKLAITKPIVSFDRDAANNLQKQAKLDAAANRDKDPEFIKQTKRMREDSGLILKEMHDNPSFQSIPNKSFGDSDLLQSFNAPVSRFTPQQNSQQEGDKSNSEITVNVKLDNKILDQRTLQVIKNSHNDPSNRLASARAGYLNSSTVA